MLDAEFRAPELYVDRVLSHIATRCPYNPMRILSDAVLEMEGEGGYVLVDAVVDVLNEAAEGVFKMIEILTDVMSEDVYEILSALMLDDAAWQDFRIDLWHSLYENFIEDMYNDQYWVLDPEDYPDLCEGCRRQLHEATYNLAPAITERGCIDQLEQEVGRLQRELSEARALLELHATSELRG